MKNNLKNKLVNCDSLEEMFEVMNRNYETEKKISKIAKATIVNKIGLLITITGIKERKI